MDICDATTFIKPQKQELRIQPTIKQEILKKGEFRCWLPGIPLDSGTDHAKSLINRAFRRNSTDSFSNPRTEKSRVS